MNLTRPQTKWRILRAINTPLPNQGGPSLNLKKERIKKEVTDQMDEKVR